MTKLCDYKKKMCDFWDGECTAPHPAACPFNKEADIMSILSWQKKAMEKTK
jgi:hypothetical protein